MAVGATRRTTSFTTFRLTVRAFLAPYLHFFFLGALDTSLAHFQVVLYFGLRELAVFPEDYVETESEYA